jgi:hypothetical protein
MKDINVIMAILANSYYLLGKRICLLYRFWSKKALDMPLRISIYANIQPKSVAIRARALISANIGLHGSWHAIHTFGRRLGGRLTIRGSKIRS